ncbi:ABC transporter permease [Peribacillus acanthi]|uniref:ABC transporter permease n=1 Tax=Peribacillus acanthi TaxID=2171554 RepID=UPI000D3E12EE|nr:ABC transporter permease [Peribacillus acanthi]
MLNVIFRSMIVTSLRDRISVGYALVFPIVLLVGLGLYFDEGLMHVRILTGVTAISTIFWGMQGIAFQVHYQRNKGVYKLLKLTPMPIFSFVFIMTLARTVIGVVLNMTVWFIGVLFLKIDISMMSSISTLLLVLIGTLCFTSIGFLIANFANNEAQINMLSNLLQLPMIFMSEAFYPLTNAPQWVQMIGKLLPFEHYVKGLSGSIMGDERSLIMGILVSLAYMIGSLILSVPTFKWEAKQNTFEKKTRKYAS